MAQSTVLKFQETARIRGSGITAFIEFSKGASFREALNRADAENRVIVSNKQMDKMLVGNDDARKSIMDCLPARTGTLTGYVEPNTTFENSKMFSNDAKAIVFVDSCDKQRYVFPVDEQYLGEKNGILVVEHPHFNLVNDGNDLVVLPKAGKVALVSNFPILNGWYLTDDKFGIPIGTEPVPKKPDARYLYRSDGAGRVGPIVRGYGDLGQVKYTWVVDLNRRPSEKLGVAVEGPAR